MSEHELPLPDEVLRHAQEAYPREACGVFVRRGRGKLRYLRCRNAAPEGAARDSFALHPQDWAAAEDAGEILAVVHSHPDASAEPSEADRAACHRSGLVWWIVAVPPTAAPAVRRIEPAELPLVGRSFEHGVVDCYSLIRDYYRQVLAIELPDFERADEWWRHGQDLYRQGFERAGFVRVGGPEVAPRVHDVLLVQVAADVPNHGAVYVGAHHGVQSILHHLYGRLSGHEPWGGYWLRHCTDVLRHRELLEEAE